MINSCVFSTYKSIQKRHVVQPVLNCTESLHYTHSRTLIYTLQLFKYCDMWSQPYTKGLFRHELRDKSEREQDKSTITLSSIMVENSLLCPGCRIAVHESSLGYYITIRPPADTKTLLSIHRQRIRHIASVLNTHAMTSVLELDTGNAGRLGHTLPFKCSAVDLGSIGLMSFLTNKKYSKCIFDVFTILQAKELCEISDSCIYFLTSAMCFCNFQISSVWI